MRKTRPWKGRVFPAVPPFFPVSVLRLVNRVHLSGLLKGL